MEEEKQEQPKQEFLTPPARGPGIADLTAQAAAAIPNTFALPGQFLGLQQELEPQLAALQNTQTRNLGQTQLQAQREFGPEAIKLLQEQTRLAAPQETALREKLLAKAMQDFDLGGSLSPEELRNAEQDFAARQVSRGITQEGLGEAIQGVGNIRGARQNAAESRRGAAFQALGIPGQLGLARSIPNAPIANRANPGFDAFIPQTGQLIGAEQARYGSPMLQGAKQTQESRNPFLVGLGLAGQAAATYYGGAAGGQSAARINEDIGIGSGDQQGYFTSNEDQYGQTFGG